MKALALSGESRSMETVSDREKRLRRIRLLAAELNVKSGVNTPQSRERCKRIALELIELLKAEDADGVVPIRAEGGSNRVVGG